MQSADILLIILSATLAIFLILSIVLTIYLIKIAKQIKNVTATAERAANKFESIATIFQKAAGPAVIGKAVNEIIQKLTETKFNKKKDKEE